MGCVSALSAATVAFADGALSIIQHDSPGTGSPSASPTDAACAATAVCAGADSADADAAAAVAPLPLPPLLPLHTAELSLATRRVGSPAAEQA